MDLEFVKWLTTLGVGGVLAGFMFHFYRKDVKTYTDQWRGQTELMMGVVKENTAAHAQNGAMVQSMSEMVRALHQRIDRGPQ